MTRSPAAALALGLFSSLGAALLATTLTACRGGLDAVCHCASDCRAGLVCEAEGEKTLSAEMCFPPGTNGRCVEADVVDSDASDPQIATEAPVVMDFPSSRDLAGGVSDSNTATGTTAPTTTDATGTSAGTGTSTGTSTGTGTSTDTGTSTSTGTSTGTSTDTGTSTTGTDTGTSTSTGTSTGTGSSSSSSSSSTT